jgi:hypothetical protein
MSNPYQKVTFFGSFTGFGTELVTKKLTTSGIRLAENIFQMGLKRSAVNDPMQRIAQSTSPVAHIAAQKLINTASLLSASAGKFSKMATITILVAANLGAQKIMRSLFSAGQNIKS